MGEAKGTGAVYLRNQLKAKGGADAVQTLLDQLTPEEQKRFHTLTHISMLPIAIVVKLVRAGAIILYPELSVQQALFQLNYNMAQDQMNGIYKILIKFATPDYVIKQAAKIWSTIHNQGKATAVKGQDGQSADFFVEEYPELPIEFMFMLEGYITGVLELAGTKNTTITGDYANPAKWTMHISWDK